MVCRFNIYYHLLSNVKILTKGLVGHLRSTFKSLFQLYLVMKSRNGLHPPTTDGIMYASGQKLFDSTAHQLYIEKLEEHNIGIKEAFAKQQAAANVRRLIPRLQLLHTNENTATLGSREVRAAPY